MSDLTANPFCPLCFGTGSWEQGERCGCVKPLQEFTSHTVTAPAPKPEANADDIRADALEYAAQIADAHWPESGHVHQEGAISCQMSISVEIRRRKGVAYKDWKPTEHEIELLAAKDAEIARLTQERDAAREKTERWKDEFGKMVEIRDRFLVERDAAVAAAYKDAADVIARFMRPLDELEKIIAMFRLLGFR
jgi:hypothetical protein